jgi:hypothetical protein
MSQVRVCIPQLPHACVDGPLHGNIWPVHAPQLQVALQARIPLLPQLCIAPGVHCPCPVHAPHADHIPVVLSQVRVCAPQLPHGCVEAPLHVWPTHAEPHVHEPPHVWVPLSPWPQLRVALGAHTPSLAHADHADQWAVVASHVRV